MADIILFSIVYPQPSFASAFWPNKRLIHFSTDFERLVNLDSLIPHLCKNSLLTNSEVEQWLLMKSQPGNSSRPCQILHLLNILDKKGVAGFKGVIEALNMEDSHAGHDDLVKILAKDGELFVVCLFVYRITMVWPNGRDRGVMLQ